MRPTRLRLTDFGSHHDTTLDLSGLSLVAITGGNGSGKSTVLAAIRVALFGGRDLAGYIRQGASKARVSLAFTANGHEYDVTRAVTAKGSTATLAVDGVVVAEKVGDVDSCVRDALGCDADTFALAFHLPQGALGAFAALDAADRKAWLMARLPMAAWATWEREAKQRMNALAERASKLDGEAAALMLNADADIDDRYIEERARLDRLKNGLKITRSRYADAERLDGERVKAVDALRVLDAKREELTAEREALMRERNEVANLLLASDDADALSVDAAVRWVEQARRGVRARDDASRALRQHEAERDAIQARLSEAQQDSALCPTCGQHLGSEARRTAESTLLAELEAVEAAIADAECAYIASDADMCDWNLAEAEAAYERALAQQHLAVERAKAQQRAKHADKEGTRIDAALDAVDKESAKCRADIDAMPEDGESLADLADSLKAIRDELTNAERELAALEAKRSIAKRGAERLIAIERELATVRSAHDSWAMLARAYSKSGIPARIIEGAVAAIEEHANDFLSRFTDGLTVTLATQRENKGGGLRETLDILVTDALGTRAIERMSGGERTRVNFALAVALARFAADNGAHVDSFTVDEPDALDPHGLAELVACLNLLAQSVPFVAVVSHHESVNDAMPQTIAVTKYNGGSRTEVTM